jgi:ribosome biogenesis GTPase
MPEGLVVKAYGGYFFVYHEGTIRQCTIRGRLKTRGRVVVGDRVVLRALSGGRGVIEEVRPRRSELRRPPIANANRVLVVIAFRDPAPSLNLLDRILVHCEAAGISAVICVNKADLADSGELQSPWLRVYLDAGYPTYITSAVTGLGVSELRESLLGRVTVLAGPSGAGKSSLVNAVQPGLALRTGEISRKLKRGRHITRHVELLPLDGGGWVADTPGFSALSLDGITREELAGLFPELRRQARPCRFTDCLHYQEPDCGVRQAVAAGAVARSRYAHYLGFLREIMVREEKRKP